MHIKFWHPHTGETINNNGSDHCRDGDSALWSNSAHAQHITLATRLSCSRIQLTASGSQSCIITSHSHPASTSSTKSKLSTCKTALLRHPQLLAEHQVRLATGSLMHDLRDSDNAVPVSQARNQAGAIPRRSCLSLRWSLEGRTCHRIAAIPELAEPNVRLEASRALRSLSAPDERSSCRALEAAPKLGKSEDPGQGRGKAAKRRWASVAPSDAAHRIGTRQPNAVKRPSISWYKDHRFREHSSRQLRHSAPLTMEAADGLA